MYKKYFKGKKGVFFDLDGTVIDSLPYWKKAMLNVLNSHEESLEDFEKIPLDRGVALSKLWDYIKGAPDVNLKVKTKDLVNETHQEYLNLIQESPLTTRDGFCEFVLELKNNKGYKLALVSNSNRKVVDVMTELLDIKEGIFDLIIAGDEVRKRKPAPNIYNKALKVLKLKPKQVLVFEDSVEGAKAAKKAGLDTIAIWEGQVLETDYPRNVLTFAADFSAFPGNLDRSYYEHVKKSVADLDL